MISSILFQTRKIQRFRPVHLCSLRLNCTSASHAECWKCGKESGACKIFCGNCGKIQPITGHCCSYFKLLDIPENYDLDMTLLEKQYKESQKKLHPDKFTLASDKERTISSESCSVLNQAYNTLKNPVERANYMLSLRGVDALDEKKASLDDQELLLEIFELRDQIGVLSDFYNASAMLRKINSEIVQYEKEFGQHIAKNDIAAAIKSAIKLKYYSKASEEIEERIHKLETTC